MGSLNCFSHTHTHTRIHTHMKTLNTHTQNTQHTHTYENTRHTQTHTHNTELFAPVCYLLFSDWVLLCSVWMSYKLRSHTNGKANWFMYREENTLLCYMQKFKRIISKINIYFPFIKMYYNSKVLFTGFKCHVKHALSA